MAVGEILGVHHVKVPVTDLARSRAWYERVLELEPAMEFTDDDDTVRGVAYQPTNDFALALRENAAVARGMAGFDPLAILVDGRADVQAWGRPARRTGRRALTAGRGEHRLGRELPRPDGLELRLYSRQAHRGAGTDRPGHRRPGPGQQPGAVFGGHRGARTFAAGCRTGRRSVTAGVPHRSSDLVVARATKPSEDRVRPVRSESGSSDPGVAMTA